MFEPDKPEEPKRSVWWKCPESDEVWPFSMPNQLDADSVHDSKLNDEQKKEREKLEKAWRLDLDDPK